MDSTSDYNRPSRQRIKTCIELNTRRQNTRANVLLKIFEFRDELHSSEKLTAQMINFLNRLKHPGAFLAEPFPQEAYDLLFEEFESRLSVRSEKDRVVGKLYLVETSFEQRCVLRPNVVFSKGHLLVTY